MENEYLILIHNLGAGSNGLLGEFNAENKYDIKSDIKDLLKKTNKLITEYKTDKITAVATVGSYTFDFVVYVQLGEQNKKRLTLFLKEKGKILEEDKEYLTVISSVIIDGSANIIQTLKKEFNMYIQDESTGIDMSNAGLIALANYKDKILARSKFLQKELMALDKAYVLKALALIKAGGGSFGNQFLLQFKNLVKMQKLDKNNPLYWHSLKKILDKMLIDNAKVFDGKLMQKLQELQAGYIHMVKNTKEQVTTVAPAKKKAEVKKKAKPKKKKPDNKKEDKSSKPTPNVVNVHFETFEADSSNTKSDISNQIGNTIGFNMLMSEIYNSKTAKRSKFKEAPSKTNADKDKQDQGRDL